MASPVFEIGKRFLLSGRGGGRKSSNQFWGPSDDKFKSGEKPKGFLSFIAWVSIVGVSVGVLALVVVTSVINGFEGELAKVMTGMNGDVLLFSREPIGEREKVEEKIKKVLPDAEDWTASFVSEVMVAGPIGVSGALVEGFDPETFSTVSKVADHVQEGRMPRLASSDFQNLKLDETWVREHGEVALGFYLAEKIGAKVGDRVRIVIPGSEDSGAHRGRPSDVMIAPRVIPVRVSGIIKMGLYEYDSKFFYTPIQVARAIFGLEDQVSSFKIRLKRGSDPNEAAQKLSENFGYPFKARSWMQLNKNLLYAIQLEKVVIGLILIVIIIVAAFNVVSTLMMMIHDKAKEIAILKAMGLRPSQSFWLFAGIGLIMGFMGTVFGVSGGIILNWILSHTQLIKLPPDIYYISFLPVVTEWREVCLIAILSMAISFLATIYPAIQVSRRSPLEGLRYE